MRAAVLPLVAFAACASGYRDRGDSEEMGRRIDDRNVETRVRVALACDPETAPYDPIRVRSYEGVVTLEGAVDRPEAKRRAVEVAAACDGVHEVEDLIVQARRD
jgi:osmotically-inducible protein OsmY